MPVVFGCPQIRTVLKDIMQISKVLSQATPFLEENDSESMHSFFNNLNL